MNHRTGEGTRQVKVLAQHEDLSSNTQHSYKNKTKQYKNLGMVTHLYCSPVG